ncbi:EF-hand domain-containing protein [Novosphingobium sp. Gsoil 351]|uniref:EF-hand domain-containing protein n=1 Tax=Novosphingobium sp. Gsoil 351 TaxID=2675225 RepID=UPI0018A8064C|nr:EF-hand domain-containing protein [Novosphingobium sp. Gsoil 351]
MRKVWNGAAKAGRWTLAIGVCGLALVGCDRKETGPEAQDTVATAPATATPVPPVTADPAATKPLLSFAGMDTDDNGLVTSAENAKASQTIFQAMDLDKDGAVTLPEMDAARDAIGERPEFSSEKLIESADADHDGKLTLGEWVAASNARFARFDANKDDSLSLPEWQAGIAAEMPHDAASATLAGSKSGPSKR